MKTTNPTLAALLPAAILAAALALPATAQEQPAVKADKAKPATADKAAPKEADGPKVIEGPVNVYTWAPDEDAHAVSADKLNMRKVFEEWGPVATQWHQHVQTLANPWFEGRAPGSRGNDLAAEYVEFWLKQAALEPAFPVAGEDGVTPKDGPWKSYRQHFALTGGAPKVEEAQVKFGDRELAQGKDFSVLAVCGNGEAEGEVVFVGYGIEEGKDGYTSFGKDDDLKGKVAMVLRYEPLDDKGRSKWSDRRFSEYSGMLPKIDSLTKRGVAGIILVAPPGARDGKERLEDVNSSKWGRPIDVPMVQVTGDVAEQILKAARPADGGLMEWRRKADEGKVTTVALGPKSKVEIETKLSTGGTPAQNVAGVLRGRGKVADEWIVVGAHFDHVGFGYFGANPANAGKLHPGADDNASGTSAMLCMAQAAADFYASKDAPADLRSVLFIAFTGEESGLRGSRWYVEHPTIAGDKIDAMINMDMVGRLRSDDLSVGGVGTAKGFIDVLRPAFERSKMTIRADPTGRGPSDHASFYGVGVPVLFIYTGNHPEYHTPDDKAYTVNAQGAAKIVALASDIVRTLAAKPEKLEFQSTDGARTSDRGYAKVRLGVMPAMGGDEDRPKGAPKGGVMVDNVSADTSAADAGIKRGDIILSWNGEALEGGAAMMGKLRDANAGDKVKVRIWRDGKELEIEVTLRASKPRE